MDVTWVKSELEKVKDEVDIWRIEVGKLEKKTLNWNSCGNSQLFEVSIGSDCSVAAMRKIVEICERNRARVQHVCP